MKINQLELNKNQIQIIGATLKEEYRAWKRIVLNETKNRDSEIFSGALDTCHDIEAILKSINQWNERENVWN